MNTKKILGIFMCMLVMTMIPVAAGATTTQNPQTSHIGVTFVQGIIYNRHTTNNGAEITFNCIAVHWRAIGLGQSGAGFNHDLGFMTVPAEFNGIMGNHFIFAWFHEAIMW